MRSRPLHLDPDEEYDGGGRNALMRNVACSIALALVAGCGTESGTGTATAPGTAAATAAGTAPATGATTAAALDPHTLHMASIVIDTHNDVTERLTDEHVDLGNRLPDGHTDLPRMREGGLDAEFLSVWVEPKGNPGEKAFDRALAEFDAIHKMIEAHPAEAVLALTADDVRAAAARGKTAFLIGVEGGHALGDPTADDTILERLRRFHGMGARYMTLTWSNSNRIGGSSGDDGKTRGLTDLGRRVVALMNELGILVDISHVSDATFFDAVKASTRPVLASHSSSRALTDHPRNMTDEMLRAVAANGGAVCVNFGAMFLDAEWAAKSDALKKSAEPELDAIMKKYAADPAKAGAERWKRIKELAASLPAVPLARLADHIDHIATVAGHDHVCLGSDFDGVPALPAGLEDVSKLPALTAELARRGWSNADLRALLGENVLRVLAASSPAPVAAP
jgi:membrane dipeptidase